MERSEYITDQEVVERAAAAVRIAIERKKILKVPYVAYDSDTQKIYQYNPDGSKTVIEDTICKESRGEGYAKKA